MCHIIGIEPQFKNIILNGPYVPMAAGVRKLEAQWSDDKRKVVNLDQHLKSLIMSVLQDDQMNSVINCETAKSTWEDLILYHERPSDVKENRVMDLKLCYNTFRFKGENLTQTFTRYKALMNELVNDGIKLSKFEINTGSSMGYQRSGLVSAKVSDLLTILNKNVSSDENEMLTYFHKYVENNMTLKWVFGDELYLITDSLTSGTISNYLAYSLGTCIQVEHLKEHADGNFTSPPGRIYRCAELEWYDLVDNERFSINRCSSLPSMNISHDDFEPTVAETPNYNEPLTVKKEPINEAYSTTVESEVDFSHSTIIQTKFPHQQLPHSFTSPCSISASAFNTPKKQHISHNKSPLYSSVNSHVHKRRKFSASETVKMEQYDSPDPKTPTEIKQFSVPQSCILDVPEASSTTCGDVTEKELKISCSLCRNPLGLVENNYFVSCSVTSLSMVHLATIWKGIATGPTSVPVVVSDIASVDRRILERTSESGIGQGIWSKEDGCVFNTIFCTFCNNQDSCLGLHVVATDSANVQFLNKLLFYSDRLEIQHIEASVNSKEVSPSSVTSVSKSPVQNPFEKFAYVPPETNSSGWRTTKSKMRLPKRVQVLTAKH
ncbi:hypothetical protein Tco_0870708 [Tanacetum coccineum]